MTPTLHRFPWTLLGQFLILALAQLLVGCGGRVSTQGFVEGGAFPSTPAIAGPWWGSWNDAGDANTGELQGPPIVAPEMLHLKVAGYPSQPGNRIYLRAEETRDEVSVAAPNAGEKWIDIEVKVPRDLQGHRVRIIAVDGATGYRGWFAVQFPVPLLLRTYAALTAPLFGLLIALLVLLGARLEGPGRRFRLEPLLLAGTGCLLVVHFVAIAAHAVNVPYLDEWGAVTGLAPTVNWSWIWSLHNEHRIVFTKLWTWVLYKLSGWNIAAQTILNFPLYVLMLGCLYRFCTDQLQQRIGVVAIFAATTLPAENHAWAFQSQFHLFLTLFILSIWFSLKGGRWTWLACLAALACAYSFSMGVICATVAASFMVWLAIWRRPTQRATLLIQAAIVLIGVALWFQGFARPSHHPAPMTPLAPAFWEHYLNLLSSGFGYQHNSPIPGALILLTLVVLAALSVPRLREPDRTAWLGLLFLAGGVLLGLASISSARAGLGAGQAKASRYTEISMILVPVIWMLAQPALERVGTTVRFWLRGMVLALLFAPLHDQFAWFEVYSGQAYLQRLEARRCLQRYFLGIGDGTCPTTLPGPIGPYADAAKRLNVSFVRELLQK